MGASSFLASFYFVCGIFIFFLAVMIVRQSSRSAVAWLTASVLLFASFGPILGAISFLLERNPREGAILFRNLVASFDYVWEFFFPSLVLFALVFPRRHRLWGFIRKIVWLLFVPHLFHLVLIIFLVDRVNPARMFRPLTQIPVSIGAAQAFFERLSSVLSVIMELIFRAHMQLFSLVNLAYAGFALIILVRSARGDLAPRIKRQMWVIIGGLGLCILTFSIARLAPLLPGVLANRDVSTGFINASLIIGGGSIGYAIVRYQFLGMRMIARRGILYVAVAALFASIYILIIRELTGYISQYSRTGVEMLQTGFIVLSIIALQPVLGRLEDWSERFVIRERHDPRGRLRNLSGELLSMIDTGVMKERVSAELREVFETDDAALVLVPEILAEYHGDADVRRCVESLANAGEPLSRADFLATLGVRTPHSGLLRRGARRELEAIIDGLPAPEKRFAGYELLVPVMRDVECVAAVLLGGRREHDRYSTEEIALISMLASQVASSLHNIDLLKEVVEKRVMEEELNIARSIQLNLLPSEPPHLDAYEIAAMSVSSKQVGGDYYDFLHRDKYLAIAVADVSGKGVPASLLMASLQASLRSNMDRMELPVHVVTRLNRMMCETTTEDKFATLFYGCLDMEKDVIAFTNAGHVFPIVIRRGGRLETLDYSGLILGVIPEFEYELREIALGVGETLVIVSDGVTEAANASNEFFGERRLGEILSSVGAASAQQVRDAVVAGVKGFTGEAGTGDDLTILVLRRKK